MNGRIITIGDIHGCHQEFADLLQLIAPTPTDRIILLGDLVNRGPDSSRVIDLARQHRAISLLGNHEARLLLWKRTGDRSGLKEADLLTIERLRPEDWLYLQTMQLTHYIPELNTVCVHGGFLPNEPWQKQPASVVTRIQVIDAAGRPRKRSECPEGQLWADLWNGPPFVIYGHTPRPDVYKLKWSIGLDTGCAMGGQLTACILPEKRIVQIKARRRYYPA
ncbi:metallophosphoesterase [Geminisphaera colitermitum]|uniref:metallophosphoesterase n=1 Tax=Geminisphaera colitermitum TaxID=1148786 RepID=UPI000158DFFD|nr:metallophosphoesterase [Geminisphaera colitermitum]